MAGVTLVPSKVSTVRNAALSPDPPIKLNAIDAPNDNDDVLNAVPKLVVRAVSPALTLAVASSLAATVAAPVVKEPPVTIAVTLPDNWLAA